MTAAENDLRQELLAAHAERDALAQELEEARAELAKLTRPNPPVDQGADEPLYSRAEVLRVFNQV